ncbi:MAG: hypothetical protein M1812_001332 [Candelaria pacifica]|nr:MAG: hypothetical protein M1812_001332 [Candelaria pacifica]
MTCPHPCHCEFCYCCGMIWKTCQCSHFNNPAVLAIDAGGLDGNGHIPVPLPTPEGFGIEAPLPLRQPLLPYVVDGIDWNAVRIEGLELEENAAVPYNVVSYGWEDVNDNGGVERAEHDDALYLHQEYFPG